MTTIKILYNDCYGGFSFSPAFAAEFTRRTGRDIYKGLYGARLPARCDTVAVALFEERGSEWCSGQNAALKVREIPAVFANYWEINEYDGMETVHVNVDRAYADCLETFMNTRNIAALERQYATIQAAKKAMCRAPLAQPAQAAHAAQPVETTSATEIS
jgi:hypothetical protein